MATLNPISIATIGYVCDSVINPIARGTHGYVCLGVTPPVVDDGGGGYHGAVIVEQQEYIDPRVDEELAALAILAIQAVYDD